MHISPHVNIYQPKDYLNGEDVLKWDRSDPV